MEPYKRPRLDDRIAAAQRSKDKSASVVAQRVITPSAVINKTPVLNPSSSPPSSPPRDGALPTPLYPMSHASSTVLGSDLVSPSTSVSHSLGERARSGASGFSGWSGDLGITPGQRNPLRNRLPSTPPGFPPMDRVSPLLDTPSCSAYWPSPVQTPESMLYNRMLPPSTVTPVARKSRKVNKGTPLRKTPINIPLEPTLFATPLDTPF